LENGEGESNEKLDGEDMMECTEEENGERVEIEEVIIVDTILRVVKIQAMTTTTTNNNNNNSNNDRYLLFFVFLFHNS